MTRPTTTGKAQDLITFTRSTTGTYLDSVTYGDELVTNGDFSTDSGWAKGSNWTLGDGVATSLGINAASAERVLSQASILTVGKTYTLNVAIDGSNVSSAFVNFNLAAPSTLIHSVASDSSGIYVITFVATSTTLSLTTSAAGGYSGNFSIDNVSVKELTSGQGTQGTPLLRTAAIDEARIEYDAEGNCLGLLVEEARTNVLTYSEDFSNGAWSKQNASITANTTVSPDGTLTGDKLIGNSATVNTEKFTNRSIYSYAGQTVTGSVYVKKAEYTWVQINLYNSGAYSNRVWVNLDTGAVGTNLSSIPVTVTPVGDSWYRVVLTATIQATGLAFLTVALADADGDLYTNVGDQYSGTYLWGAQLEAGSFPTSYIPTSGSAVTRAADLASLAVSEFGYNQDQGTVVVSGHYSGLGSKGTSGVFELNQAVAAPNGVELRLSGTNGSITGFDNNGVFVSGAGDVPVNSDFKIALGFVVGGTNAAASYNGSITNAYASVDVNTVASIELFKHDVDVGRILNGHIKSVQYYPLRLSNAQLQALTV